MRHHHRKQLIRLNRPNNARRYIVSGGTMKSLKSEITINAGPDAVWSVLTDFDSYPKWNPFIVSITGAKNVGGQLVVTIRPPGSRAMTFKPVVLSFQPEKEFRWRGKLLIKGLFDGEHHFQTQRQP